MPRAKEHFAIGAVMGAAVNILKQLIQMELDPARNFNWAELAFFSVGGGLIGLAADVFEPATTPNHRGFFHSVAFGSATVYATHGEHTKSWEPEVRAALRNASYCYVSHLVADATTPKGIRLI
jgi:membrane-bound metal-dependent hydrolase YbcI (DUF457 family)